MKFDAQGLAALKVAISRKLIVRFFGASRPFRYLEEDFSASSPSVFDVEQIGSIGEENGWFPEVDKYISAPKYFRKRFVFKIREAAVDTSTGYIYDSEKRLLGDFISWSVPVAVADRPALASKFKKVNIQDEALYLGPQGFYHWLIEDFPAYLIAKKTSPSAITFIKKRSPRYILDALQLLNAEFAELPVAAVLPTLIMASKSVALVPSQVDVGILREFGNSLETPDGGPEKIYISRRDSGRMPNNELEIETLLSDAGFQIVQLSEYSLLEQITLFKNASVIVGTHGAGLANLAWCDASTTRVIEIKQDNHPKCFEWLAIQAGLNYTKVENSFTDEWFVDLNYLAEVIT